MSLYSHQQKIIDDDPKKTGLFLGTGSGKTRIALMLAEGRTLVIAPKTQVEDKNWQREYKKSIRVSNGGIDHEGNLILDYRIESMFIISKEKFRRDWESLPQFDTVIVDEAHTCLGVAPNVRYRNKKPIPKTSQLFEALDMYLQKHNPERFYPCTATPIRSPMTVWAAGKLLGKKWDFYKFRDEFYFRLNMPGREVWSSKDDSVTKNKLAKLVQKLGCTGQLSDYFDVPKQTYKVDYVELTTEQKKRIKELPLEYPDPLVLLGKTHQVEQGILAGDEFNEAEFFSNAKLDKLLDYALEFPRMIVFAKYRAQIDQIAAQMLKIGKEVFVLTGDTKDRGNVILEANNSKEHVFIVQSQISSGWQLGKTKDHPEYFDCNVVIFASMDYQVVNRLQGEGRILRADNIKKNLYIDLVVKGGIDEEVYKSINNKKDFSERIYLNL